MRTALVTAGTRGDAQPMVVLGTELRRRGHDVSLGLPPNLVDFGTRAGFPVNAIRPDSQAFMESPEGQGWLASGNVKAFMDGLSRVAHENEAFINADILKATEDADLIVTGVLTEDRAACIGEARSIPVVALHSAPSRPTRTYPNYIVTTRSLPAALNRGTGVLFQRIWWRGLRGDINRFRAELDLAPAKSPTASRMAAAGALELQAFSPTLAPGIDDYGPRRPIIGFLTPGPEQRAGLGESGIDADLDAWLADGEPPAYFGFGSMPVTDPSATHGMICQVTDRLGLRALVSAGWSRMTGASDDGTRVRVVGAVNHDLVMPRCRLAVHHGGAGTTAASVSAGIPTVVCSVFADQPFWGVRLEELGAGAHLRFSRLSPSLLEEGLQRALRAEVADRANELGAALRRETDAANRAAEMVEKVSANGR